MSKNSLCLVAVAAVGLSVLGCGSDDGKSNEGLTGSQKIEACEIVTQQAAEDLFGAPAVTDPPVVNASGLILGQCHWTTDDVDHNQLLQFFVWDGTEGYSAPSDSEPFAIGEEGNIRIVGGGPPELVDVEWVQSEMTLSLSYQALGNSTPIPAARIEALKTMALGASSKLESD